MVEIMSLYLAFGRENRSASRGLKEENEKGKRGKWESGNYREMTVLNCGDAIKVELYGSQQ